MDNTALRRLARSNKWQTLYNQSKERNLKLFLNDYDLTSGQIRFLYWLRFYENLYIDYSMKEPYISIEVIEDNIRADAYMVYKNNKKDDKKQEIDHDVPGMKFI